MKKLMKVIKWTMITVFSLIIISILSLRLSRFSDRMIYQTNGSKYAQFSSELNHTEYYFEVDQDVKLHGVLFQPDSVPVLATIFHYSGKGMHLMSSIQKSYRPLLQKGFQVFCYERRGFGKSSGEATNSRTLQKDALLVFDKIAEIDQVKGKPILIWGQSLGGAFATMTSNHRQHKIKGLVLEGAFSSFPDIGKVYARALNLENFKWLVPLIMNNDFAAEREIRELIIPITIIHSKMDKQVPYKLGRKLYRSSKNENIKFWDIDSKHIVGIFDYEKDYVNEFLTMLDQ